MRDEKPNLKDFVSNIRKNGSWYRKIHRILKNSFIKLITLKNCCGHPGEPGC